MDFSQCGGVGCGCYWLIHVLPSKAQIWASKRDLLKPQGSPATVLVALSREDLILKLCQVDGTNRLPVREASSQQHGMHICFVMGMHWIQNESSDQIGKTCPENIPKVCWWAILDSLSTFRTLLGYFSDIWSRFSLSGLSSDLFVTWAHV